MSKRWSIRLAIAAVFSVVGATFTASGLTAPQPHRGYGKCHKCSCPGFQGSTYTCSRGGCKHHYDCHW
jgi:hypothetical protein